MLLFTAPLNYCLCLYPRPLVCPCLVERQMQLTSVERCHLLGLSLLAALLAAPAASWLFWPPLLPLVAHVPMCFAQCPPAGLPCHMLVISSTAPCMPACFLCVSCGDVSATCLRLVPCMLLRWYLACKCAVCSLLPHCHFVPAWQLVCWRAWFFVLRSFQYGKRNEAILMYQGCIPGG